MSEAGVIFEVREVAPDYFTYDVAIRPADDLPKIPQASGACRCELSAELAAAEAVALVGVRLARMGAAPLPVHRVGLSPRDRARSRVIYNAGLTVAVLVSAAIVGAVIGGVFALVDHLIG